MKLFVYGSLLSGECNHGHLAGSIMLGVHETARTYTLVDLGAYPALLEGGTTSIRGEIYEVDSATLAMLDALEGHPRLYRRVVIRLDGGPPPALRGPGQRPMHGQSVTGYVLVQTELARGRAVIASGDWRTRRVADS